MIKCLKTIQQKSWSQYLWMSEVDTEETSAPTKTPQSPRALGLLPRRIRKICQWENQDIVPFNATSIWANSWNQKAATLLTTTTFCNKKRSVFLKDKTRKLFYIKSWKMKISFVSLNVYFLASRCIRCYITMHYQDASDAFLIKHCFLALKDNKIYAEIHAANHFRFWR